MRSTFVLLFLATAVAAQEPIAADRPGIADGSQTVGRGTFQMELGWERDHFRASRQYSTPLLLRYGVGAPLEVRVESAGYTSTGWAPPSIGGKYHFAEKPSLGVIARYFPPFRSERSSTDLRLAADIDLSETWALNPNAGVVSRDDGGGRFTAALAALTVEYNVTKTFNLFVDGAVQTPEARRGKAAVLADTGAVWIVGNDLQLDVEAGWGVRGQLPPNVFVGAGISRRF